MLKIKYIASVSFGKDSLAMLLKLLEKNYKLDEIIFYDTGMEFKAIYNIRDKIKLLLKNTDIKLIELKPDVSFVDKMFNIEVHKKDGTIQRGYGLCGGKCRWGTEIKNRTIKKYLEGEYQNNYLEYVGIAIDEISRIEKAKKKNKLLPLVEWKMTEKQCLQYCYDRGFYWEENGIRLYDILDRVSCWCCANKNKKELENMRVFLPEYYLRYIDMLKQIKANNKKGIVVENAKKQFMKLF